MMVTMWDLGSGHFLDNTPSQIYHSSVGCLETQVCTTVGKLPVKLGHKDTILWMVLVKAGNVVNDAIEAETKHTCWHGSCDDSLVEGETPGAGQRLVIGNTALLRETPSVINRALLGHSKRSDCVVWDLGPRVQG
jgi:hypothetical protein